MIPPVATRVRHAGPTRLPDGLAIASPARVAEIVNEAETDAELKALRQCVQRGPPFGSDEWIETTATQWNLESTQRSPGRPRKIP